MFISSDRSGTKKGTPLVRAPSTAHPRLLRQDCNDHAFIVRQGRCALVRHAQNEVGSLSPVHLWGDEPGPFDVLRAVDGDLSAIASRFGIKRPPVAKAVTVR